MVVDEEYRRYSRFVMERTLSWVLVRTGSGSFLVPGRGVV